MPYLPFYGVGVALAAVMVAHWLLTRRMMAVSGRVTALVNRWREGPAPEVEPMSQAELLAAVAVATRDAFGDAAVDDAPLPEAVDARVRSGPRGSLDDASDGTSSAAPAAPPLAEPPLLLPTPPQRPAVHLVFFAALAAGGLFASLLTGGLAAPVAGLRSASFASLFGDGAASALVLLAGGVLVGFGTRMAAGCTSGHALCGLSRAQPGSALATAVFFGAGIVVSFAIGGWS